MPRNQERSRLRLRDMRDLSMLVGECRALGGDGIRWRQLLVTRIRKLLDADMAYLDADMAYFNASFGSLSAAAGQKARRSKPF